MDGTRKYICFVAGARPNFMKISPIVRTFNARNGTLTGPHQEVDISIVHTGQHYDHSMSNVFFQDLEIPDPDYNLNVGSGSHAFQTGQIMIEFEKLLFERKPDLVVVVGDVNSTIACSLTSKKLGIPVAHIEAGLRSFDMGMPEEINRKLTDAISDLLFVTEKSGESNLINEGVSPDRIKFVGNVMIDTLYYCLEKLLDKNHQPAETITEYVNDHSAYGVLTLHRPSNVDDPAVLKRIWKSLISISDGLPIIFPVHPRTRSRLEALQMSSGRITMIEPVGYLDMLYTVNHSALVLTDSGGLQEETTVLGKPCVTLRENTERPATIELGTNYLVGTDPEAIMSTVNNILQGRVKDSSIPPLWDGKAAVRIASDIIDFLESYQQNNSR